MDRILILFYCKCRWWEWV